MKQSRLQHAWEVFPGSDIVLRFSFRTVGTRGNCAHLAVENHQLAMTPINTRGQSAHLHTTDCFECLSPHKPAV